MLPLLLLILLATPSRSAKGPHIADLNVLLPPRLTNPVEYRLQGSDGCFSWSWEHHDILSVQPEYDSTDSCSTSARLISIAPYSGQKETAVYATDLTSGTVIRCEVFIDKIARIQIFHHSVKLDLHGLTTLHVRAFDQQENVFSSLAGLQFFWQLTPKPLDTDALLHHLVHVPLKDTPLSDCGGLCGDLTTRIKLEDRGVGSDLYVVRGTEIGLEIVSVHLLEPQLEHVADEIVLTVVEAISLDPPSPVIVISGASIHYTLRVIHQNTPQAIPLPSPHHQWSVSNASVAQIDSAVGLAHALNLGITHAIVEDIRVTGHTQMSCIHVVLPEKLVLYILPVTISYEPLEAAEASSSKVWHVIEGRQYVIYLKVFSRGPVAQEIYITESDDVHLQCNHSIYWDSLLIPSDVAAKYGWRNSCLIKATSHGLGTLKASLAYPSENMERAEIIKTVQEVMVCEMVKISAAAVGCSHTIHLPWSLGVSQEIELKATGGCAKNAKDHRWFSSDSAIVSVSANGLVSTQKPGRVTIKAVSVFDSSNYDEVTVEVSIPSSMNLLRYFPVEAVVGTYLHAAVTMEASSGSFYCRCDSFSSSIRWQVLAGGEYFKITNTSKVLAIDMMPYPLSVDVVDGAPCSWASLYASNAGRAMIQAATHLKDSWSSDYSSDGKVTLKASGMISSYHPLFVHQAGDGNRFGGYWVDLSRIEAGVQDLISTNLDELYLVPGTGLDILLLGGPERWDQGVDFVENVEIIPENQSLQGGILVDQQSYGSGRALYKVLCQTCGDFKILFSRGNLVGDDHPLPAIANTRLSLTCSFPSSITLVANEPVNRPDLILSSVQADRGPGRLRISPITVPNACIIRISAVAIHSSGKVFANASSLRLNWVLSHCDNLGIWEEEGNSVNFMFTWEKFLVLRNVTGMCTVRATIDSFTADGTNANLARIWHLKSLENVLSDAINLQLVSSPRISPEFILLFFHPDAKVNLSISGGTCSLDPSVNDTKVVEVIKSPTRQCYNLVLGVRGLGIAHVTALDIGLAVPVAASALAQVSDVDWIKIISDEEIWLSEGAIQSIEIVAGIHDGTAFDSSQYAYMNVHVHVEEGVLELVENDGFTRLNDGKINTPNFSIRAAQLGITTFHVSAVRHSGHEISSQLIKVEVYAPLRIFPQDIFIAPGASYAITVRGGPTTAAFIEYDSEDGLVVSIHRSSGKLSAVSLGNATLRATAYGNGGALICEAYGKVKVGIPSTMNINLQSRQLGIGCEMPASLSSTEGSLFSFYELCKHYRWTIEHEEILSFKMPGSLHSNDEHGIQSTSMNNHYAYSQWRDLDFIRLLFGRSAGKTTVAVSFSCDFVSSGFPLHSVAYEASESLSVISDPPLALGLPITWVLPPFYTSSNILPLSSESYGELDSSGRPKGNIIYSVLRTCGGNNEFFKQDAIAIDGGKVRTRESNNLACIQAKDRVTGRTEIASCIRVAEITQVRVIMKDFTSHVANLPLGARLKLVLKYADALGNPFYEASDVVPFVVETNYPDVVSIKISDENSTHDCHGIFYIQALRHGRALVQISISSSPLKADYLLISVGAHLTPQNPVLHVGHHLNFSIDGRGNDDLGSGKWFSGNRSVVSVNEFSGEAYALGEGSSYVYFEDLTLKLQTIVTVVAVSQIIVDAPSETLTNVPFPAKGYKFIVRFSNSDEKSFEAMRNDMQVLYDCRVDPTFIGYAKPWRDRKGSFYCLFFPHSPEHFMHSLPKLNASARKNRKRGSEGLYISMIASSRQKGQVFGSAHSLFVGGFSVLGPRKVNLTSDVNTRVITIIGNTDVEIHWHLEGFMSVILLGKDDLDIVGHAEYLVKTLKGESFIDKIIITLPPTGQTEEIEVIYSPGEKSTSGITNAFIWTAVFVSAFAFLLAILLFKKLLESPNASSHPVPAASASMDHMTHDPNSSETLQPSPQTPQPYVEYVKRTIDETPYYRRGRRRFDPQYTY